MSEFNNAKQSLLYKKVNQGKPNHTPKSHLTGVVVGKGTIQFSYLTIGKDTRLESLQDVRNDGTKSYRKDVVLRRKGREDIVKGKLRSSLFGADALDNRHRLVGCGRCNHRKCAFLSFLAVHRSQANDHLNGCHVGMKMRVGLYDE